MCHFCKLRNGLGRMELRLLVRAAQVAFLARICAFVIAAHFMHFCTFVEKFARRGDRTWADDPRVRTLNEEESQSVQYKVTVLRGSSPGVVDWPRRPHDPPKIADQSMGIIGPMPFFWTLIADTNNLFSEPFPERYRGGTRMRQT